MRKAVWLMKLITGFPRVAIRQCTVGPRSQSPQPVRGEFIKSRGNPCLVQPATVLLPAIRAETRRRPGSARIWQAAFQPRVRPVLIEILLKLSQLRLQVRGCPE